MQRGVSACCPGQEDDNSSVMSTFGAMTILEEIIGGAALDSPLAFMSFMDRLKNTFAPATAATLLCEACQFEHEGAQSLLERIRSRWDGKSGMMARSAELLRDLKPEICIQLLSGDAEGVMDDCCSIKDGASCSSILEGGARCGSLC